MLLDVDYENWQACEANKTGMHSEPSCSAFSWCLLSRASRQSSATLRAVWYLPDCSWAGGAPWTVPHALPPADFVTCCQQQLSCQWTALWLGSPVLPHTLNTFRCGIVCWNEMRIVSGASVPTCCASASLGGCWNRLAVCLSCVCWHLRDLKHYLGTPSWLEHLVLNLVTFISPCYYYVDSICDSFLKQNIMVSSMTIIKDLFPSQVGKSPYVL